MGGGAQMLKLFVAKGVDCIDQVIHDIHIQLVDVDCGCPNQINYCQL